MAAQRTREAEVRAAGPVRITLPAKIAYNPDLLKRSIANLAERLGCGKCFSGADCLLEMQRRFVVDQAAKVTVGPELALEPQLAPSSHRITVGLSSGVKNNLDNVLTAIDAVIDKIGTHPCISGFDVLFKDELQTIVVNERLQARRFGQKF